jgi:adenylate kinase family enzyme
VSDPHSPETDRHHPSAERFVVIGTTGAGKTTVAREIARILDVPHVEFDSYRHGPNWTETPDDVFREQLSEALQGDAWVADGNYSVARDVVWPRATTLVWLDYPIHTVMWRLFWRTLRRGVLREELWNGNKENIWEHFFTRESLFLWAWRSHWRRRRTLPLMLAQPEHDHLQVVHLHSPKSTREWVRALGS